MHLELAGQMYQKKSLFSQALTVDFTSTISPTQQVFFDGLMTLFLISSLTVKGHPGSHSSFWSTPHQRNENRGAKKKIVQKSLRNHGRSLVETLSKFRPPRVAVWIEVWSKFGRSLVAVWKHVLTKHCKYQYFVNLCIWNYDPTTWNFDQTATKLRPVGGRNFDRVSSKLRPPFSTCWHHHHFFVDSFPLTMSKVVETLRHTFQLEKFQHHLC